VINLRWEVRLSLLPVPNLAQDWRYQDLRKRKRMGPSKMKWITAGTGVPDLVLTLEWVPQSMNFGRQGPKKSFPTAYAAGGVVL
jgi:hypothetical protein